MNALYVPETPYLFVLYENGRAVFQRAERGSDRRWIRRYRTALLSTEEMEELRQAVEPSGLVDLAKKYNLLPEASDLSWITLSVGAPWLASVKEVSVRGFLEPKEIASFRQPPPPPAFSRAYDALVSARFSNEAGWEPEAFRVLVSKRTAKTNPRNATCVMPSDWLREVCSPSAWPGWSSCAWLAEGRRLIAIQELKERCDSEVSFHDQEVGVSIRVVMPHERGSERLGGTPRQD